MSSLDVDTYLQELFQCTLKNLKTNDMKVPVLTDLYGQTMSLFYNFEYCHPGPLVNYAKQITGIRHIVESIPNAFSSISNG